MSVVWVPPSAFGSPLFLCACRALSRLLLLWRLLWLLFVCLWRVVSFFVLLTLLLLVREFLVVLGLLFLSILVVLLRLAVCRFVGGSFTFFPSLVTGFLKVAGPGLFLVFCLSCLKLLLFASFAVGVKFPPCLALAAFGWRGSFFFFGCPRGVSVLSLTEPPRGLPLLASLYRRSLLCLLKSMLSI